MANLPFLIKQNVIPKNSLHPIRALGIDLGTTNCAIAEVIWDPQEKTLRTARCIEMEQQTDEGLYTNVLIPSVVAIHNSQTRIGEGAKRLRSKAMKAGLSQNQNLFYDCKNEIGTRRTYHRAPEGFQSPSEIAGHILQFVKGQADQEIDIPIERIVVTVPASFQAAQRRDTLIAGEKAGLSLKGGDLLDEPVAAFLDYLVVNEGKPLIDSGNKKATLVVFDFGGGTCDVAVFQVGHSDKEQDVGLEISPLAVSRYHRLGGGDIDAAILYDVLLPQLIEQNEIPEFDLGFREKKLYIEPAFLSLAESLKIKMCSEIARLKNFGRYEDANKTEMVVNMPGVHHCLVNDLEFHLKAPSLSAAQFEKLMEPFLDRDLLYVRETEYRLTCSIFAPLQDALDRSGLDKKDVNYCLLVGGSTLIPQVKEAVSAFLPKSVILSYKDRISCQTAVARGAAYHALSLALYGEGLVHPVCPDSIRIRTQGGSQELIPKGAKLPYPGKEAYESLNTLKVPESSPIKPVDVRIEIFAEDGERPLFCEIMSVPAPVNRGTPLKLEYQFDENQVLNFRMTLPESDGENIFEGRIENPLTNVVNPNHTRLEIEEIEERLRMHQIPKDQIPDEMIELARKYAELRQYEKALEFLRNVLRVGKKPNAHVLNLMGIYAKDMGNYEDAAKFYLESAKASNWGIPLFNLALMKKNHGKNSDGLTFINQAIEREPSGPYFVLRAMLLEALQNQDERDTSLREGMEVFGPVVTSLNDWELGWFRRGAEMLGLKEKLAEAIEEQKTRVNPPGGQIKGGVLPGIGEALRRVD